MKVFLLKDVEKVGLAGEVIKVSQGYGANYLIPHKLAVEVTKNNENFFKKRARVVEHRKDVVTSKTSMLAEKIESLKVVLKKKSHDDGKLYGAVSPAEIVDRLKEKGVSVAKKQVEMSKSIKTKGSFDVTIRLSSKLKPKVTVQVVPE